MGWETRRAPRQPIAVRIRVRVNPAMKQTIRLAKESIEADLIDVGGMGIGLVSQTYLPPGAVIDFDLPKAPLAPSQTPPLSGSIPITGRIVHARPEKNSCRMGLEFIQIDEKDRQLIQRYAGK